MCSLNHNLSTILDEDALRGIHHLAALQVVDFIVNSPSVVNGLNACGNTISEADEVLRQSAFHLQVSLTGAYGLIVSFVEAYALRRKIVQDVVGAAVTVGGQRFDGLEHSHEGVVGNLISTLNHRNLHRNGVATQRAEHNTGLSRNLIDAGVGDLLLVHRYFVSIHLFNACEVESPFRAEGGQTGGRHLGSHGLGDDFLAGLHVDVYMIHIA